eukprot:705671-Amphidinium_carterae.1
MTATATVLFRMQERMPKRGTHEYQTEADGQRVVVRKGGALRLRRCYEACYATCVGLCPNKGVCEAVVASKRPFKNPKLEEMAAGLAELGKGLGTQESQFKGNFAAAMMARRPGSQDCDKCRSSNVE